MAGNIFAGDVSGVESPTDISPIHSGGATRKQDTSTAQTIAKVGALAESAGKSFLQMKVESDVEDAQSGAKDFLTDTPSGGIARQRDKILEDFGISMDALAQGSSPELALLNAQAAIKKVSSIAPGWEQDIKKAAIDKLGYDPGGLLIKSALQRQAAEFSQEMEVNKTLTKLGYDPSIPAHRQAGMLVLRTKANLELLKETAAIRASQATGNKAAMETSFNVSAAEYNAASADGVGAVLVKYSQAIPYAKMDKVGTITNMEQINVWWGSGEREVMLQDILNFKATYIAQMNALAIQTGAKPASVNAATSTMLASLNRYETALQDKDSFKKLQNLGAVNDANVRREMFLADPAAEALWHIGGGRIEIGGTAGELLKQTVLKNLLTKRGFLKNATNRSGDSSETEGKWYDSIIKGKAGVGQSDNDIGAESAIITHIGGTPALFKQVAEADKPKIFDSYIQLLNTPRNTREYKELAAAMSNPDFSTGFINRLNELPDGGIKMRGNIHQYQTAALVRFTRDVKASMSTPVGPMLINLEKGKPWQVPLVNADAMRIVYDPVTMGLSTSFHLDPEVAKDVDPEAVRIAKRDVIERGSDIQKGWADYRNIEKGVFDIGRGTDAVQQNNVDVLVGSGLADNIYLPNGDPLIINETAYSTNNFESKQGKYGTAKELVFGDKVYVKSSSAGRVVYVRQL
jgi:hypothetical protein